MSALVRRPALVMLLASILAAVSVASVCCADEPAARRPQRGDVHDPRPARPGREMNWPTREQWLRVLLLRDYNTRVVLLGTVLLGSCAGVVGTFMLLRKRALIGDVISHSSLPGIAVAFLLMETWRPGQGKSLPGLLAGAAVAGLLGVVCVTLIRRTTRIKDDAALAVVLSVFFGLGIALFTVIQKLPTGNASGLKDFILGRTAAMIASDVWLIAAAAAATMSLCWLLFKEFALLCFDQDFASTLGWPVVALDLALMALVVCVTVIGLQSVGLLLVVALLIVPAAAARFWTDRLLPMAILAGLLGGGSASLGVVISALLPRLAAGPVIVLVGACCFAISMFCGARRGVLRRVLAARRSARRVGQHDLLRAAYECVEPALPSELDLAVPDEMTTITIPFERLLALRSWTPDRLGRLIAAAVRDGLLSVAADGYRLTHDGALQAFHAVRNHRLWETYLIAYADVAPSQVDRDADRIEHVLEPELIDELEDLLSEKYPRLVMPPSPHPLQGDGERMKDEG